MPVAAVAVVQACQTSTILLHLVVAVPEQELVAVVVVAAFTQVTGVLAELVKMAIQALLPSQVTPGKIGTEHARQVVPQTAGAVVAERTAVLVEKQTWVANPLALLATKATTPLTAFWMVATVGMPKEVAVVMATEQAVAVAVGPVAQAKPVLKLLCKCLQACSVTSYGFQNIRQ